MPILLEPIGFQTNMATLTSKLPRLTILIRKLRCQKFAPSPLSFFFLKKKYCLSLLHAITLGSTAKGDESPTSPPVNEAAGIWILNPNFLRKKENTLSNMI